MISLSSRADERFFRPWSYDELNRLLASGRTMPGEVCGLLAADWWHAFLLVVLNTGAAIADVLLARPGDYARRYGTLTVGMLVAAAKAVAVWPEGKLSFPLPSGRCSGKTCFSPCTAPNPAAAEPPA